jgi:Rha family phage regulatory protein
LCIKRKEGKDAKNSSIHRICARKSFSYNEAENGEIQGEVSNNRGRDHQARSGKIFAQYHRKITPNIITQPPQKSNKKEKKEMKDLVQMIDGKAVTTSRKVAEVFEKQHKHVLETIRNLEIPETYREPNFRLTVYEQPNPSGGKPIQQPEYLITRDGFTILAMGFTGKKAMQFKIAYIEAFNEMEKTLKTQELTCCAPTPTTNIVSSTAAVIEKINYQILRGEEVDPEILRYAWNIGRLIGKHISRRAKSDIETFICDFEAGTFERGEVYQRYCAACHRPVSARRFWPIVRSIRPCEEFRNSYKRFVVFE